MSLKVLATGLLFVAASGGNTPDVDAIKEKLKGFDVSKMMAGDKLDFGELGQGRVGQPSPEAMAKTMAAIKEMRAKEAEEKEEERRAKEKKAAKGKRIKISTVDESPSSSPTSSPPPTPPTFNSENVPGDEAAKKETAKITRTPSSYYNSEAIPGEEDAWAAMSPAERNRLEAEENLRRIEEAKKDPATAAYLIEPEKRKPQVEIKTDEDGVPVGGWERAIYLVIVVRFGVLVEERREWECESGAERFFYPSLARMHVHCGAQAKGARQNERFAGAGHNDRHAEETARWHGCHRGGVTAHESDGWISMIRGHSQLVSLQDVTALAEQWNKELRGTDQK
jgi:hypothetical protein